MVKIKTFRRLALCVHVVNKGGTRVAHCNIVILCKIVSVDVILYVHFVMLCTVQRMYDAMTECQALHPDTDDSEDGKCVTR